jgi:hypothetical protein
LRPNRRLVGRVTTERREKVSLVRVETNMATTTKEASCATDALSSSNLTALTLGFKAFSLKHVKSGFHDPSCVACIPFREGLLRHTAGYTGKIWPNLSGFPLPYPCEPPYVLTVLPTVGSMDYSFMGYSKHTQRFSPSAGLTLYPIFM